MICRYFNTNRLVKIIYKETTMGEINSHFRDGVQYAWDSTSIKYAQKCLRYYKYKMIDNWEPRNSSVHLIFGGHYAKALEFFHKLRAKGFSVDNALHEIVKNVLEATWINGKPWDSGHDKKTRNTLIRSIIWYVDQFHDEEIKTVILPDGKAAVEYSFTLQIDNGLLLSGHIDRLCLHGGDYYVMDQKTTSTTINGRFFDAFNPDTQMSLYTFAGRAIYDLPVKGVIIDCAQIAVGFTRFDRGFTFRTDDQLDEWYDGILSDIERAQKATATNDFPVNPSSCGNYGGCEFRNICSKSPSSRENFLRADFVKRKPWNPLESR